MLKNGRRIRAERVIEEGDRVSWETPAGRLTLPKSMVARIERGPQTVTPDRAELPAATPPQAALPPVAGDVAAAVVAGGAVDHSYLAELDQAARSGPPEAVARMAAGRHAAAQFELERGQADEALNHYRRVLALVPDHLGALLYSAYLHLRKSEFTAALDYLERARRIAPDSPDAAKLAGWAHYGANRIDRAVEAWKLALRLRPDVEVERALEKAERELRAESDYRAGETLHFTLRYHGGAAPALAREILMTLEEHFRAIASELNYTPPEPIGVILYTGEAFADISRAPRWVSAVNDGRLRLPVQGLTSVTPELSRVLKHELTHSFLAQKTRGRCPVWLHEGLAQWIEGLRSRDAAAALVALFERKGTLPLAAIEGSLMEFSSEAAGYAYAWSLAVVESVIERHGLYDIVRLLDGLLGSASAEGAVKDVLRMDYAELEQETANYLRDNYLRSPP